MCMVRLAVPRSQAQLVVVVQAAEAAVRVGEVLEMLLRRRTRRMVEWGRKVRRLEVGLGQLVLHGGRVMQASGAAMVGPGAARTVAWRAAA